MQNKLLKIARMGFALVILSFGALPAHAWDIESETSLLTDEKNVYITTESNESLACSRNQSKATLQISCRENVTFLVLVTDCHLTSSEYNSYGEITYRIDSMPARTKDFTKSTNNKALGLWEGWASLPLIRELVGSYSSPKKLVMRFTPYGESSETITFNIRGLKEKIRPLAQACNWKE